MFNGHIQKGLATVAALPDVGAIFWDDFTAGTLADKLDDQNPDLVGNSWDLYTGLGNNSASKGYRDPENTVLDDTGKLLLYKTL